MRIDRLRTVFVGLCSIHYSAIHSMLTFSTMLSSQRMDVNFQGYCQGMAFLAGILLMYMPERLAFEIFCKLMSKDGPNLRRYYLDGLSDLKHEMAMFEFLLARHHPRLSNHLQQRCIPSVLYVSQWLLTIFACPFPVFFTAQIIDILLLEDSDRIVMQVRACTVHGDVVRLLFHCLHSMLPFAVC